MSIEEIIINGYIVNVLLICIDVSIAFTCVIVSVFLKDGLLYYDNTKVIEVGLIHGSIIHMFGKN